MLESKSLQPPFTKVGLMKKYKHVYARNGIIYIAGTIQGVRYRKSTGKVANALNMRWCDENWQNVLQDILANEGMEKVAKAKVEIERRGSLTLERYAEKMFEIWQTVCKKSTLDMRKRVFRTYVMGKIGDLKINEIDYSVCRDFIHSLKDKNGNALGAAMVKNVKILLNLFLNEAVREKIIAENPMKAVRTMKVIRKSVEPFTEREMSLMIESCENSLERAFIVTAFFTGMRTGELLALQWDCVDFTNKTILVKSSVYKGELSTTKTGKERQIDMLPIVESALKRLKEESNSDFCFCTKYGKMLSGTGSIRRLWCKILQDSGIAYRNVYQTRHTFASLMISKGENVMWVQRMLGHSDLRVTFSHYAKYVPTSNTQKASFVSESFGNVLSCFEVDSEKNHAKNILC